MNNNILESAEFYNRRYHNFSSRVILPTLLLFLFGVFFLAFAKKEISIISTATVEPNIILSNIQSTSNNTILTNNLKDNKYVKFGDLLIKYDSRKEGIQQETYQTQLNNLQIQKEQLELLKASIEAGNSQFPEKDNYGYYQTFIDYLNQINTLSANVNQQNENVSSQNTAASNQQVEIENAIKGLTSQISDYQSVRSAIQNGTVVDLDNRAYSIYRSYLTQTSSLVDNTDKTAVINQFVAQIDSQINQLESSVAGYRIQHAGSGVQQSYSSTLESQLASLKAQSITKVEQELSALSNQITELEGTNKLQKNTSSKTSIVANEDGVLHLNQEFIGANIVPEGTIFAQVYPEMKKGTVVKITGYLPSTEISSISIGDTARFSTKDDNGETLDLIVKLSSIDNAATKTKNGNYFKVESKLQLKEKEAQLLKYGLEGKFILITGT
ncbi:TPA: bacteriocin secretion accessory protein, partial [Streptococcus equi subsp. zooepidemicus]|nr:bacteriocin secretion accessory protein [Streptococcus equi subsp. zooepidemicus]